MTKASFVLTFTQEELRELVASHLDDRVFGMSVNVVDQDSLHLNIEPDGGLRVVGRFQED